MTEPLTWCDVVPHCRVETCTGDGITVRIMHVPSGMMVERWHRTSRYKARSEAEAELIRKLQAVETHACRCIVVAEGVLYRWVAIIDAETCEACRALHDRVFQKGELPMPPLHNNEKFG